VVKTWDISTGLCKASFQTIAKDSESEWKNVWLVNSRLINISYIGKIISIWDVEKGEPPQTVDVTLDNIEDIRLSGDGSIVFSLHWRCIQAWSIQMGKVVGKVELGHCMPRRSLTVDGSRVWVHSPQSGPMGWDFGAPGSHPAWLTKLPLPPPKQCQAVGCQTIKDQGCSHWKGGFSAGWEICKAYQVTVGWPLFSCWL